MLARPLHTEFLDSQDCIEEPYLKKTSKQMNGLLTAVKMSSLLKTLSALAKDLGSIRSIHMVASDYLQFQFQRIQHPLLTTGDCMQVLHRDVKIKYLHTKLN